MTILYTISNKKLSFDSNGKLTSIKDRRYSTLAYDSTIKNKKETNKICDKYYWKFYEYKEYILINYNIRLFFKYTLFVWFIFFVFYTPELIDFVKMLAITPFTYNDNDKLDRIITDLKLKKTINNLYNNYLETNYFSLKLIEFKLYIVTKTGLYKNSNGIILAVEDVDLSRDLSECKESLKKVYESIKADENFRIIGYYKKMFLHGKDYNDPKTFNPLHNAVAINSDTTFEEYYSLVRDSFIKYWVEGYDHYYTRELRVSLFGVEKIANSVLNVNKQNKVIQFIYINILLFLAVKPIMLTYICL
jgi:hypothetical protein